MMFPTICLCTIVVLWSMFMLTVGQKTTTDENSCSNTRSVEDRLNDLEDTVRQQQRVTQEMEKQLLQQQNVIQQMHQQLLQLNRTENDKRSELSPCNNDTTSTVGPVYGDTASTTKPTDAITTGTTPTTRNFISAFKTTKKYVHFGGQYGAWLLDPVQPDGKVWVVAGWQSISSMNQYGTLADLINDNIPVTINFPGFTCEGTGHAVWKGHLFCNKANTSTIVKMNIEEMRLVKELTLHNAGYHNQAHYNWGGYSDIDIAIDELGMWVIYGSSLASYKIAVAHVDTDTMTITKTWQTNSRPKTQTGNAFMISGVLYVLNTFVNGDRIDYLYDTETSTGKSVDIDIRIPGPTARQLTQMSYMPGMSKVLVWDVFYNIQEYPLILTTDTPSWLN